MHEEGMQEHKSAEYAKAAGSDLHGPGASGLVPVTKAVGMVLAHDITEIRPGEFKGRAFRKGHVIREEDVCHLQRLGKEHLFVLDIAENEMHEDDAVYAIANALMGKGVAVSGEPKEGKITIIAETDGLLKINKDALLAFNMLGDVMCASLHDNTVVMRGQAVAGTRAIPLIVMKEVVQEAVRIARAEGGAQGVVSVKEMRKPKTGIVITGNEVYYGRIKDSFAPVLKEKISALNGEIIGTYYAPDDGKCIEARLRELVLSGADLLVLTGGMSVDPDDVTRFAVRNFGARDIVYGTAVLPGAMFLVGYVSAEGPKSRSRAEEDFGTSGPSAFRVSDRIPVLGVPACALYHKATVFDLVLPRLLAGETIGRRELAEFGHGGLCLNCTECRYPVCPFGK
jgi:hypothetical protein